MLVKREDKTNDLKMNQMFSLIVEIILIRISLKVVKMNFEDISIEW